MRKSEFVSKYYVRGYNGRLTGGIEYTYRYIGHEYTVYVNTNSGNEPLSWQHRMAQDHIDNLIEMESKEDTASKEYAGKVETALSGLMDYWES